MVFVLVLVVPAWMMALEPLVSHQRSRENCLTQCPILAVFPYQIYQIISRAHRSIYFFPFFLPILEAHSSHGCIKELSMPKMDEMLPRGKEQLPKVLLVKPMAAVAIVLLSNTTGLAQHQWDHLLKFTFVIQLSLLFWSKYLFLTKSKPTTEKSKPK